jgi:hypothetical protein
MKNQAWTSGLPTWLQAQQHRLHCRQQIPGKYKEQTKLFGLQGGHELFILWAKFWQIIFLSSFFLMPKLISIYFLFLNSIFYFILCVYLINFAI